MKDIINVSENKGFPKPPIFFGLLFFAILFAELTVELFQHHHYGLKIIIGGIEDSMIAILVIFPVVHWVFYKPAEVFIEKLQESEAMQRLAATGFNNSPYGIIIMDKEFIVLQVNKAFCQNTGYGPRNFVGIRPDFLNAYSTTGTPILDSLTTEGRWEGELYLKTKSRQDIPIHLIVNSICDDYGEVTRYLAMTCDISADHQLRQELISSGKIQRSSLPQNIDNDLVTIKGLFYPLNYVGGDIYTYSWNSESKILDGYMLDVMGHGMSTALQISALQLLFRRSYQPIEQKDLNLSQVVQVINRDCVNFFSNVNKGSFVGAICFNLDLNAKQMSIVGAGIGDFILISEGTMEIKTAHGLFLGISPDETFDQMIIPVKQGDTLIFATDGFFESLDESYVARMRTFDEAFDVLSEIANRPDVRDDCTALVIHIKEK